MKLTPWLVLLSLVLVSCSGSKSAQNVSEETPQIELSDADEFIDTPADGQPISEEPVAATELSDEAAPETAIQPVMEEPVVSEFSEPIVSETAVVSAVNTPAPVVRNTPVISNEAGTTKTYTVQKNETLMLIAFKLYGDYEQWKQLASQNRDALNGSTNVKEGMVLKYVAPAEEFVWNPQGLPYLIRTGDTLGGISKQVYSTLNKWKLIWDNNRPLIKDPNRIFAGFTIYYLENGREVATEI